jgi:four helix bundle protein
MLDAGCWMFDALARALTTDIHRMTIRKLPKFKMYEEGSQIHRSMKSIRSNIVEGYGRRRYKQEFIRFLTFVLASSGETTDHLEMLCETESLKNEGVYLDLHQRLDTLGRKRNSFLQSVEAGHRI